jgi:hypothetical protein
LDDAGSLRLKANATFHQFRFLAAAAECQESVPKKTLCVRHGTDGGAERCRACNWFVELLQSQPQ